MSHIKKRWKNDHFLHKNNDEIMNETTITT